MNKKIGESSPPSYELYMQHIASKLACFKVLSKQDTINIVKTMKNKSCLLDPISYFIFRDSITEHVSTICLLSNASILKDTVPKDMKTSVIKPIYKQNQSIQMCYPIIDQWHNLHSEQNC